jgi:hypothetical protein
MSQSLSVDTNSVEGLISQVADEYLQRLERGERADIEEYAGRYPQIAGTLRQVLPALALMRQRGSGDADTLGGIQPEGPLGDYRIVREIGRGGMGVVYEAVQISLGRRRSCTTRTSCRCSGWAASAACTTTRCSTSKGARWGR